MNDTSLAAPEELKSQEDNQLNTDSQPAPASNLRGLREKAQIMAAQTNAALAAERDTYNRLNIVSEVDPTLFAHLHTDTPHYYLGEDFHSSKADPNIYDAGLGAEAKAAYFAIITNFGQSTATGKTVIYPDGSLILNRPSRAGSDGDNVTVWIKNPGPKGTIGVADKIEEDIKKLYELVYELGFAVINLESGETVIYDLTGNNRGDDLRVSDYITTDFYKHYKSTQPQKTRYPDLPANIKPVDLQTPNNNQRIMTILPETHKIQRDWHSPFPGPIIETTYKYTEMGSIEAHKENMAELIKEGWIDEPKQYHPSYPILNVKGVKMNNITQERMPVKWVGYDYYKSGKVQVDGSESGTKQTRPYHGELVANIDSEHLEYKLGFGSLKPAPFKYEELYRTYIEGEKTPIINFEGEPDTEAAWFIGLRGHSFFGGVQSYEKRSDETYFEFMVRILDGEPYAMILDNDKAGQNQQRINFFYHNLVKAGLEPHNFILITPTGNKADFEDYVSCGGDRQTVIDLIYRTAARQKETMDIADEIAADEKKMHNGMNNVTETKFCNYLKAIRDITGNHFTPRCPDKNCLICNTYHNSKKRLAKGVTIPAIAYKIAADDSETLKIHDAFIKQYQRTEGKYPTSINDHLGIVSYKAKDTDGIETIFVHIRPHRRSNDKLSRLDAVYHGTVSSLYELNNILTDFNLDGYLESLNTQDIYPYLPKDENDYHKSLWGLMVTANGEVFADLRDITTQPGVRFNFINAREPKMSGNEYFDVAWVSQSQKAKILNITHVDAPITYVNTTPQQDELIAAAHEDINASAIAEVFGDQTITITDIQDLAEFNQVAQESKVSLTLDILEGEDIEPKVYNMIYTEEKLQRSSFVCGHTDKIKFIDKQQVLEDLARQVSEKYGYEYNDTLINKVSHYRPSMSIENRLTNQIPDKIPVVLRFLLGGKPPNPS